MRKQLPTTPTANHTLLSDKAGSSLLPPSDSSGHFHSSQVSYSIIYVLGLGTMFSVTRCCRLYLSLVYCELLMCSQAMNDSSLYEQNRKLESRCAQLEQQVHSLQKLAATAKLAEQVCSSTVTVDNKLKVVHRAMLIEG